MGGILDLTSIVANHNVRVMIFAMGNPGNGINKSHGLIVVLEIIAFSNYLIEKLPSLKLLHQQRYFIGGKRGHIALAGFALLSSEIVGSGVHCNSCWSV